jgi:hypothetical protein
MRRKQASNNCLSATRLLAEDLVLIYADQNKHPRRSSAYSKTVDELADSALRGPKSNGVIDFSPVG